MSQSADTFEQTDRPCSFGGELTEDDGGPISLWPLVALAILGLLLIWIILGIWRYLQVIGYGAF